ncbi:MAG: hypothetical protein U9N14_07270 [Pseudomonadota bacterium]|nr:hypothetical protein [Pseudomonadota bacterium]
MRKLLISIVFIFMGVISAQAADLPDIPALKLLKSEGAVITRLGSEHGVDGWLVVKGGDVQIMYSTPDGRGLIVGLLFGPDGLSVTQRQLQNVRHLLEDSGLIDANPGTSPSPEAVGERLWNSLSKANWFAAGPEEAPVLYIVIDPRCQACKMFWRDLAGTFIAGGAIQARLIPIGILGQDLGTESRRMSALLFDSPDPLGLWGDYIDGLVPPDDAKPSDDALARIERNTELFDLLDMQGTPYSVYRATDKTIKIVLGQPRSVQEIVFDMIE